MKNLAAAFLTVILAVGLALAAPIARAAAGKTHQFDAEFVSADSDAKTLTVKTADGKTLILRAEDQAMTAAKDLKAGEKVTITCRDSDKGAHEAVVSIERAKG
jgi:hypothetical protein